MPTNLFGRGVERRPFESSGAAPGLLERQGEAEIENARPHVRPDDDVFRFKVPMQQAVLVRHRESARDFPQQAGFLLEIQFRRETVQRKTFDSLHDDGRRADFVQHGVNRHDGWVRQRRGVARLLQDSATNLGIGQ